MGLGINVAFSFFMKLIYIYVFIHTQRYIHVPNLLNGHAIVSIKKSRRKDDSRVSHTRRPQDSGPAGEAGARCAASRFYLVSQSRGRAAPGGRGRGPASPVASRGHTFQPNPATELGPQTPAGQGWPRLPRLERKTTPSFWMVFLFPSVTAPRPLRLEDGNFATSQQPCPQTAPPAARAPARGTHCAGPMAGGVRGVGSPHQPRTVSPDATSIKGKPCAWLQSGGRANVGQGQHARLPHELSTRRGPGDAAARVSGT